MPILYRMGANTEEGYPGIPRTVLVDASHGAESLWVGHPGYSARRPGHDPHPSRH